MISIYFYLFCGFFDIFTTTFGFIFHKIDNRDIHIITADQFAHEHLGYDKETLYWWRANNLLTTEDFDILDVPELIGNEWQGRVGEFEPNVVYVRNETAETDYEIVEQKENYYDYKE